MSRSSPGIDVNGAEVLGEGLNTQSAEASFVLCRADRPKPDAGEHCKTLWILATTPKMYSQHSVTHPMKPCIFDVLRRHSASLQLLHISALSSQ